MMILDNDGHLLNPDDWSEDTAQLLASTLDVVLNERHFEILHAVRGFYELYRHSPSTRPLIKHLNQSLSTPTSNSELQTLFNTGLVARHVNRLAGLPKPANCL